jgi:hypothetical protein
MLGVSISYLPFLPAFGELAGKDAGNLDRL